MLRVQNGQLVIDESAGVSVAYKPGDMYGYPVRYDHIPNPEGNQSVVPNPINGNYDTSPSCIHAK